MQNSRFTEFCNRQITSSTWIKYKSLMQISLVMSVSVVFLLLHFPGAREVSLSIMMTGAMVGVLNCIFNIDFSKLFKNQSFILFDTEGTSPFDTLQNLAFSVVSVGILFAALQFPGASYMLSVGGLTMAFMALMVALVIRETRLKIAILLWNLASLSFFLIQIVGSMILLEDSTESPIPWSPLSYYCQTMEWLNQIALIVYAVLLGSSACWVLWELKQRDAKI